MLSTKDVIQYLNQHGNVQAIEDMAAFFSVTPRTIRNLSLIHSDAADEP